jgi:hypothetical protein
MNGENGHENRKKYEPPKVTVISLRPEEAVLGHCKSPSLGGPAQSTCSNPTSCTPLGS